MLRQEDRDFKVCPGYIVNAKISLGSKWYLCSARVSLVLYKGDMCD